MRDRCAAYHARAASGFCRIRDVTLACDTLALPPLPLTRCARPRCPQGTGRRQTARVFNAL